MKIAVTGAAGRVGKAVMELAVAAGHAVVPIDLVPEGAAGSLDVRDYGPFLDALTGCDALLHLAAIAGPGRDPDHVVHDNNVVSSYHALRAAAEAGIGRVVQASSVNAIGGRYSRWPRYDYFPVDERHPAYPEDPYSLSKWICEQQADAIVRRFGHLSVASLRLHGVVTDRAGASRWVDLPEDGAAKQLWGYVRRDATARAFLLAATAGFDGHEVCYVVAPDTMMDTPSLDLRDRYFPGVPVRNGLDGTQGFFDCRKAAEVLGWSHDAG